MALVKKIFFIRRVGIWVGVESLYNSPGYNLPARHEWAYQSYCITNITEN